MKTTTMWKIHIMGKFVSGFLYALLFMFICGIVYGFHFVLSGANFQNITGSEVLTIWASVITIVFLVFSVIGLMNIDSRVKELNETRDRLFNMESEIKEELKNFRESAAQERKKLIDQAEVQVKKLMDKSAQRQNIYDSIAKIQSLGDPDVRIKRLTDIIRNHTENDGVNISYLYILRGESYQVLRRYDEAKYDFNQAMQLSPNDGDPYNAMGVLYAQFMKQPRESIEFFKKAIERSPNLPVYYENLATSYSAINEYDKADECYQKANDYSVESYSWYYNKALMLSRGGEDPKGVIAERYYRHCLRLNPHFYKATINLAMIYRERNDNAKAREILTDFLTNLNSNEYVQAVLQRGICSLLLKNYTAALCDFNYVYSLNPKLVQNLSNLARTTYELGYFIDSEYWWQLAVKEATAQKDHLCDADLAALRFKLDKLKE